jgi:hypothetical protein
MPLTLHAPGQSCATLLQVPDDAHASEVVDATTVAAASAPSATLGLACREKRASSSPTGAERAQSNRGPEAQEHADFAAAVRFAKTCCCADVPAYYASCRSPSERAASPTILDK